MFAEHKTHKAGRPGTSPEQRWLQSMQTLAWYIFVYSSGINFKAIRIQYSPTSHSTGKAVKRHYADRDRQWHRWAQGSGPVKPEVLQIIDNNIPGSMATYQNGPEGSRLWHTLKPDCRLNDELFRFSQPNLNTTKRLLDSGQLMATPWHRISFRILTYRLRRENMQQPRLPGDHILLGKAARESFATTRKALLDLLQMEKNFLHEYALYPQDILYLLEPEMLSKAGNIVQFSSRDKHIGWQRMVEGLPWNDLPT